MSEHVTRTLLEDYGLPPERVAQVGAGCNIPDLAPPAENRYERQNMVFVGGDWERKGGPELVEAFRRILGDQRLAGRFLFVITHYAARLAWRCLTRRPPLPRRPR